MSRMNILLFAKLLRGRKIKGLYPRNTFRRTRADIVNKEYRRGELELRVTQSASSDLAWLV